MDLETAILLYFASVFLVIVVLTFGYGLKLRGTFVIALLLGQILLNVVQPPTRVNGTTLDTAMAFYLTIQVGTPIVIALYALGHALYDRSPNAPRPLAIYVTD